MTNTHFKGYLYIIFFFIYSLISNKTYAQSTNSGIFFQAVAKDNFSNPAKDRRIYVHASIIQSTPSGDILLIESFETRTDASGVFTISIGKGTKIGGKSLNFQSINWSNGPYFLNLKISITPVAPIGNWDYTKDLIDLGTTSFGTVPFALYADNFSGADLKLDIKDTTSMLSDYAKNATIQIIEKKIATKISVNDTLTMLAPYAKLSQSLDSAFVNKMLFSKVNIIDSNSLFVTPSQLNAKTFDAAPINDAIALKASLESVNSKADTANVKISLALKAPLASPVFTGIVSGIDKTMVGLSNVDNTTDLLKPISNSTQTALNLKASIVDLNTKASNTELATKANLVDVTNSLVLKAPLESPTFIGIVNGIDKTMVGLNNVDNTTDLLKPISAITQAALDMKATIVDLNTKANSVDVTNSLALKAPIASPAFTGNASVGGALNIMGTTSIGTTTPASAAALDITSTTQGLLLPRLTYAQKSAIVNPVAGLLVWCTNCGPYGEMQVYNGMSWTTMTGADGSLVFASLSTSAITLLTNTSLTTGGVILSDGDESITSYGFCWNTAPNPTILGSKVTTTATISTPFTYSINVTSLTPGTKYYGRAYATNSVGTAYGQQLSFTTLTTPTITTTSAAISITTNGANSGGAITADGGASVSARGIVWSTSTAPTIALSTKTIDGIGTGTFTSTLNSLMAGTTYYVRSYATNSIGTVYGAEINFTTLVGASTLSNTTVASSITGTTALTGGNVISDGGGVITARGVCWSTISAPTIALSTKTIDAGTTGIYTSSMTGLAKGTIYFVRSYAINSVETSYGTEISFTTLKEPTLASTTATSLITATSASSGGSITADGGASVTSRGIVWSTSTAPTIALSTKTTDATGTGTYTSSITGLTPNTNYYVRSYATNSLGTNYGTEIIFITLKAAPTMAATTTATSVTSTTAITGGNIVSDNGDAITARGVVWSTSTNPAIALSTKTTDGTGAGTYTSSITGLNTTSTTYYVRSYATNTYGTSYGAEITVRSSTVASILTTSLAAYNALTGGNMWVEVTATEYENLNTNIIGSGKYGVNDAGMALAGDNLSWGGAGWYTFPKVVSYTYVNPIVEVTAIPANNYVFAFEVQLSSKTIYQANDAVLISAVNSGEPLSTATQLGGGLPASIAPNNNMVRKYFVLKQNTTTTGASPMYIGYKNTNAQTNYVIGFNSYLYNGYPYSGYPTATYYSETYYTPMQVLATPIRAW